MSEYRIITRVLTMLMNVYYYYDVYKTRRLLVLLLFFNIKKTKLL